MGEEEVNGRTHSGHVGRGSETNAMPFPRYRRFGHHLRSAVVLVWLLTFIVAACGTTKTPSGAATPFPLNIAVATPTATLPPLPTKSDQRVCDAGACLALNDWADAIDHAINHDAVGYSYLILSHGQPLVSRSFGFARTSADAPATAFTVDAAINVASVSKTLMAVAALALLGQHHIAVDAPMSPYLPKSWALGPNINTITFRQLLDHTSGIRSTNDLATTYDDLRGLMAQGIHLSDKVYHYQNHNFALFRILIPDVLGFSDAGVANPGHATALRFLSYIQSFYGHYFSLTCTPGADPPLAYPFPDAGTSGFNWGDWLDNCGAAGFQLSVRQLGTFLARYTDGAFLSDAQMLAMDRGFMGWDYFESETIHGRCYAKNGFLYWHRLGQVDDVTTLLVTCPQTGLGFVAIANSRLGTATAATYGFPGSWDDIVGNAYAQSWR